MTTRQEFEVWAESEGYLLNKLDDNSRSYESESTRYAWYGYKAAQAKLDKEKADKARLVEALHWSYVNYDDFVLTHYAEDVKKIVALLAEMETK